MAKDEHYTPSQILRIVFGSLYSVYWVVLFVMFHKARHLYPFKERIIPLVYVIVIGSFTRQLFNMVHAISFDRYLDDPEFKVEDKATCIVTGFCHIWATVEGSFGGPLVGVAYVYRIRMLIYRHEIQRVILKLQELQAIGQILSAKSIELQNNYYLKHRKHLTHEYAQKFMFGVFCVLFVIHLSLAVGVSPVSAILTGSGISFLIWCYGFFLTFKLLKLGNDNFGILPEMRYTAAVWISFNIGATIMSVVDADLLIGGGYLYLYMLACDFVTITMTLLIQLLKVDKTENVTALKNLNEGIVSRVSSSTRRGINAFTSEEIVSEDIKGFITSKKGYKAFMAFLETEFSTENLSFWKDATLFKMCMEFLLDSAETAEPSKNTDSRMHGSRGSRMSVSLGGRASFKPPLVDVKTESMNGGGSSHGPMLESNALNSLLRNSSNNLFLPNTLNDPPSPRSTSAISKNSEQGAHNSISSKKISQISHISSSKKTGFFSQLAKRVKDDANETDKVEDVSEEQLAEEAMLQRSVYEWLHEIYDNYFARNAPFEVNVSAMEKRQVNDDYNEITKLVEADPSLKMVKYGMPFGEVERQFLISCKSIFKQSSIEVVKLMKHDSFRRFEVSKFYKDALADQNLEATVVQK